MKHNDKDIDLLLEKSRIRVTDEFSIPPVVLTIDDSTIGTLGNFSATIGKAKSRKTFAVSTIVASAMLNNSVLNYNTTLPFNKNRILYIDTEQSSFHCINVIKRILQLANLPTDKQPENLEFLSLRRFSPETRIAIVEKAIYSMDNLGLVILDGVRDLAFDINSASESTLIINKLMQWTDERNIHIHTILHQNKGDEHARGHLGTELNNKAETIMQVVKNPTNPEQSIVSSVHIRAIEFSSFAFHIDNNGLPQLADDFLEGKQVSKRGFKYDELTEEQHLSALEITFSPLSELGFDELIKALTEGYASIGYAYGRNKIIELNKFLLNKRLIIKNGRKYSLNPHAHY